LARRMPPFALLPRSLPQAFWNRFREGFACFGSESSSMSRMMPQAKWRLRTRAGVALAGGALVCAALGLAGCKGHSVTKVQAGTRLDFNQDVQPILASNCFSCHGPDPEMRMGGLRLDLEESAFRKRPGHPDAIVPGHPEQSELMKRIESHDAHYLMPQNAQGEAKPMKPEEIAILKEWIREGAVYRPHWAFEKPVRPAVPVVDDAGWAKTPIDDFILAKLKKEGLKPQPEADKATLIRRVTLDLTGLLPTPAEVAAFEKDTSPNAYEKLVDGLLARPAYGEDRTRYWLDYARYADTYGLHFDNNRHAWPYRDYLIRSFNENKPFDQFAMEQIAGDMMPAKNLDPLIATGYVRAGVSSNEGGTIPEELKTNIARERTEAYGAAFLGLTVGCAVCHDHKYDPTTQKDFYSLSAFFNNIEEQPFNNDKPHWAPVVRIPRAEHMDAYNKVLAKRSDLQQELNAREAQAKALVEQWVTSRQGLAKAVSSDGLVLRLRLDEGSGAVVKNSAPHAAQASFTTTETKPEWGETTWLWPDFRMSTSTKLALGQTADYEWNQPFSTGGWFMLRSAPNFVPLRTGGGALLSKMDTTNHYRGWDLSYEKGILSVDLVDEAPKDQGLPPGAPAPPKVEMRKTAFAYPTPTDLDTTDVAPKKPAPPKPPAPVLDEAAKAAAAKKAEAKKAADKADLEKKKAAYEAALDRTPRVAIKVSTVEAIPLDGKWDHIFFTYDGSGKASGVKLYFNGQVVATKVVSDTLKHGGVKDPTTRTTAPMQMGWRYPDATPARETRYQDIRVYGRALTPDETKKLLFEDYVAELTGGGSGQWDPAKLNEDQWHVVTEFYLNQVDGRAKEIRAQMATLDKEMDKLSEGGDISIVSWEKPSIAYADVLARGVYSARMERVEANTPHFLPPLPQGVEHNRLALAKWTVSAENPLTARVTVNRMWNEVFGTGLVETTEDFGIMGGRPSHPALLDWLAVEFRESGWDIKHMYKLMVMSAAYRQSSKTTPEQESKDPRNLLLARGPRFRMDAEMLRDVALESGGLLVNKIGGPSVKPYQPANVWEQVGYPSSDTIKYEQDHGDALYRRSMYTYWKRMAPMPDMDAFDAPMRDAVCTRRQRTDTPLQALVTMNDVQWVEAARALAERVIDEGGKKPEDRMKLMGDILLAHDPPPQMDAVLEASLTQMERHYAADPKAAGELIKVGEKPADQKIPAPELAAWTMVASEMLNLDETVTK
jgi:hypothetical protein